ncbi:hypothetical protein [Peptoanaerobacter stomatis]|uniref:hypothetical protein n=1 Tax=Peptoanaerobacter stomatis TaxID=796937 RepID=UPI003FA1830D
MFSSLSMKSKMILIVGFILICSVIGLGVFFGLSNAFPKKTHSENKSSDVLPKEDIKKEDEVKKEVKEQSQEDENSKSKKAMALIEDNDIDYYISKSYKVGTDIDAGIYKVVSDGENSGQYTITDKNNKNEVDFYEGKIFFNFRYVELKENESIYLVDADLVKVDENSRYSGDKYISGQYKVGFDIPPGSYKLVPTGQAGYVEVSTSPMSDVIFSRYVEKEAYIEIKQGQYLTISGVDVIR